MLDSDCILFLDLSAEFGFHDVAAGDVIEDGNSDLPTRIWVKCIWDRTELEVVARWVSASKSSSRAAFIDTRFKFPRQGGTGAKALYPVRFHARSVRV